MYQTLGTVFPFNGTHYQSLANNTLSQALCLNGGGVNALLRDVAAGPLNAGHTRVDDPLTAAQFVSQSQCGPGRW